MTDSNFSNNVNDLIAKFSNVIKQQKVAIFCGAGISYNSGLPLAHDLLRQILSEIDLNESDSSTLINSNLPFEAFIQTLIDESDTEDILDIFGKGEPNTNHELIAELIINGFVKTVITTNFDLLIEKSLLARGFEKGNQFEVYKTEEEFGNIRWDDSRIRLIKIHGCASDKKEMAITMQAVASRQISQNKSDIIQSFFSNKINPFVCVMGYSCSDLFDISPQIESIEANSSEIYFIEHVNSVSDLAIEDIKSKEIKNPFKKFVGNRIIINADTFVKELWESVCKTSYQYKYSSLSWKENIRKWLNRSIEYSHGIKNHIAGRLFYDIGEYEHSVRQWEKGIAIAQKDNNQLFFYSQLGNLGMAFNALGRYKEATRCLEESVNACREIGNVQGEVSQLQALGNIYRNLREFEKSITVFKRAVSLAEKNELDGLCTSLGNLATVYNQTEQPEEAIKTLQRGISIAIATGNKQSEGSMLCSIGITYFQIGDYEKAISFVQQSVNVTRLIGDRQGECMALHNLSNLFLQFQDFDNCLKVAKTSLHIAQTIGIRQSEASAYYNIGSSLYFKGDAKLAVPYLKKAIEIYNEIFGSEHQHTLSAAKALYRAEKYPDFNQMTNLNLI